MGEAVLAAIITGSISLLGMIITTTISSASSRKLIEYQINELKADVTKLNERVNKHNNLVERMALVEASAKSAHKRIDEMKGEH